MFSTIIRKAPVFLAAPYLFVSLAYADCDSGRVAWDAGRPVEALSEWRAAADQGDARAMLALGQAYVRGLGVPQDFVEAHMWLNLAAARGDPQAAAERDALAGDMTAEQRAEAQKQAREWQPGGQEAAPARSTGADSDPPPERARREAQALLAELGYKPGAADGIWGRGSIAAYRSFLRDAGMELTDVLTPEAFRAMRTAVAARTVAAPPENLAPAPPAPGAAHRAAVAGDSEGLAAALASGVDANARDSNGWTALMHAANSGRVLLIPPLLEAGADPNARAPDGATALFIAALHGHAEIVEALTAAGGDPTIAGPKGRTAEQLVAARIVETTYLGRRDALHAALRANESAAVIKVLLDDGADIASRIKVSNEQYPEYPDFFTPLHTAARYGRRPEVVALLIDSGARLEEEVETQFGNEPPKGFGVTALALALSMNEDPAVAMFLVDRRSGGVTARDETGTTPLHLAALNKNPQLAALLLDQGAAVNAQQENGWAPLHLAVGRNGNVAVAKLLLEHGASLDVSATYVASPMHYAATEKNLAAATLLHEYRTETYACFPLGEDLRCGDPVCWAARTEDNDLMIRLLLDKGAERFPEVYLNTEDETSRCIFEVLTKRSPHPENRAAAEHWMSRHGIALEASRRPSSNRTERTRNSNNNPRTR